MIDRYIAKAKEVIDRCNKLAKFSETPGVTTRTFLSPPMRDCHREIRRWVESWDAQPSIDAAGNFRAVYGGQSPDVPRLLMGSHLDTVPNAGAYDGILGVALAVAVLESLDGKRLPFAIELIGFSEEDGVRFKTPFLGSRALVGRLDQGLLERVDANGISILQAIEDFGLSPSQIPDAALKDNILGYIEFHIEQGPVLDQLNRSLGVVDAIVGQSRAEFTFIGSANHAGTTPMNLRRDAIAAAAEWIVAVEAKALGTAELTATVGTIEAKPGAANVIAGKARVTVDLRHRSDEVRRGALKSLTGKAAEIAGRRGLTLGHTIQLDQNAVAMDSFLAGKIDEAIRRAGCEPLRMVSGAGHDAMILAERVPAAMVFLRSPGGVSHSPEETVKVEDVATALEAGIHLLDLLASSSAFQRRMQRA